jgi:hypothetical protein
MLKEDLNNRVLVENLAKTLKLVDLKDGYSTQFRGEATSGIALPEFHRTLRL